MDVRTQLGQPGGHGAAEILGCRMRLSTPSWWAPRVLIANSNLVGDWANWEHVRKLEDEGLMMYGQMTAGSWMPPRLSHISVHRARTFPCE